MEREIVAALEEIGAKLDRIAGELREAVERTETLVGMMSDVHAAWCLEIERQRRTLPDTPQVAVGPGDRVSWTDPKDASNVAWGGTVEFVGLDRKGTPIAHVDFHGYGKRNLPVDQLIVGILT